MAKLPLGGASLGPPTTLSLKEADLFKNEKPIGNTFHWTRQISELKPEQSRERMQKKKERAKKEMNVWELRRSAAPSS